MRPLRDSLRWLVRSWRSGAVVTVLALSACGGGSGSGDAGGNIVATVTAAPSRIEIAPNAVLLTAPGQTKALRAKVYDSANNEINVAVQWESTRPGEVAVSGDGLLTAAGGGGSSQITARIGNLKSPPLLAVHTQLPAGAVLLTDANIVGEPEETTPGAVASMNNTYRVQLTGMPAPAVGSLLINTEGKVVGGRVTAVETINGIHHVTLALVPAREMFPQLNINEVIDLNQAEVVIPAAIQAQYDIRREGNTFTFTPKPGQISLTAKTQRAESRVPVARMASLSEIGEFKLGPFTCKAVIDGAAGAGSLPVALTLPPLFTVALNERLDIVSTPANGLERFVLHSEPNVTIEAGLKALLAFEGKVTCEAELFVIPIPVGGPIALFIGGQLPVGAGVELGGKVTLANMGLTIKGTAKTTGDVGLACPPLTVCAIKHEFSPLDITATLTPDLPSAADFRIEPSLSAYPFIKASIGNPRLKSLRFDAFKVRAGMALKGNFAPQIVQLADPAYQSDYKLVSELKAGVDTGFTGLAGLLGLNAFAETLLEVSLDVANSPTGAVSADKAQYDFGESMSFKAKFDPGKINFLGLYNVQRVVLLKNGIEVGSITPNPGQAEFDFNLVATTNSRADEFSAFVVTSLLPLDLLSLELGQAMGPTVTMTSERMSAGLFHTCALTSAGGLKCWGYNFAGTLGNGSTVNSATPVDVVGLSSGVVAVGSGHSHTCALTSAGSVKCWGNNQFGQLGDGSTANSLVPVAVSGLGSGVVAVSAGSQHSCALTSAGGVKCWGSNFYGSLGNGSFTDSDIPVGVTGLDAGVISVRVGGLSTCALTSAGSVKCWGHNGFGQLGNGSTADSAVPVDVNGLGSGVVAVSAGINQTCAITYAGGLKCWGRNLYGGLGDGSTTNSTVPVDVTGLSSGVVAVDIGQYHSCAITSTGSAKCWGLNGSGGLGNGNQTSSTVPVDATGLSGGVVALSIGDFYTCARYSAGGIKCVGSGQFGQLGSDTAPDTFSLVPLTVPGFP